MLQEAFGLAGLARRHGRRQVDQPLGVGGEPAHDLQAAVAFSSRMVTVPRRRVVMIRLPMHILGVQQVVVLLLGG